MDDLSASDLHDIGECGGTWKPCATCVDEWQASQMKRAAANRREDEERGIAV